MNERIWTILIEALPKMVEYGIKVTIPLTVLSFSLALVISVIVHELPRPTVVRGNDIGVVIIVNRTNASVQKPCGGFRGKISGDAGKLNLNAKVIAKQLICPPFGQTSALSLRHRQGATYGVKRTLTAVFVLLSVS